MVYRWGRDLLKGNPTIEAIYRWVPGHRGVLENETADHWAKQGAMVQAASESLKYHLIITYKSGSQRKMPKSHSKVDYRLLG
jgi:hypothetical protein